MSYKRDKAIANEFEQGDKGYTPDLMCSALGCPNRWSVDAGKGRLCSAHHSVDDYPHLWPQITQQELDLALDRAQRPQPLPAMPLTRADKTAILLRLQAAINHLRTPFDQRDTKAWARDLQAREDQGARLTKAQRDMWRTALNILNAARDGQDVPTQMITESLRHTGDIAAHD
jgi:hypothetical protein